jgi:hypothetical protein
MSISTSKNQGKRNDMSLLERGNPLQPSIDSIDPYQGGRNAGEARSKDGYGGRDGGGSSRSHARD